MSDIIQEKGGENRLNVKIKDLQVINTAPEGINLTIVKIITNQDGLYGYGCATFSYRHETVTHLILNYFKPLLLNRNVDEIEDIWQLMYQNAYWRNGGLQNNAIAGIDMALWDIKGKMANMPCYQFFGGKVRDAIPIYKHVDGKSIEEIIQNIYKLTEQGISNIRIQFGGYGSSYLDLNSNNKIKNTRDGIYLDNKLYMKKTLEMFEIVREEFGSKINLIHDIHERLSPQDAVIFAKKLEKYDLLFLEDPVSLDDLEWLERIRNTTTVPIGIGELFNNPKEWSFLIERRLIDYIRVHISQIGGVTPAKKLQIFSEHYGVKTAWHGPGDMSPIAHNVNLTLDISSSNFGIQEWSGTNPPNFIIQKIKNNRNALEEVFIGMSKEKNGYVYLNDKPGWGIEIDEEKAKLYPCSREVTNWTQTRREDGSIQRP